VKRNSWSLHVSAAAPLGPELAYSPFGRLPSALVGPRLFRFLAQAGGTIRILLAHGPLVGQIPRAIHDDDQRAYYGPIDGHVGEDAGSVGAAKVGHGDGLCRHGGRVVAPAVSILCREEERRRVEWQ